MITIRQAQNQNCWHFTDSDGIQHEGTEWLIDMQKMLVAL